MLSHCLRKRQSTRKTVSCAGLSKKFGRGVLEPKLIRSRDVEEVCVLDQGVQPVVPHGPVSVPDYALRVATSIASAERAITDRMIELTDYPPVGGHLEFEVVAEQPQAPFYMGEVKLFCVVPAILDPARELHLIE